MGGWVEGRTVARIAALTVMIAASAASSALAQVKASEKASVSQTIDGTTITLEYNRPSIRGRDMFGAQVHWGEVWTPGANEATTIESNKDFHLNGNPVPAGKYSVWFVVDDGDWEVVLDTNATLYHTNPPGESEDQIRFMVTPEDTESWMETLAFFMPAVRADGADLRFHWANTVVDFQVEVEPTQVFTVTPEQAAPYLGRWKVEAVETSWREAFDFETEIRLDGEHLLMELSFGPDFSVDVGLFELAEQIFGTIYMINGEPAESMDYMYVEFLMDGDGTAETFEVRNQNDDLDMKGTRVR